MSNKQDSNFPILDLRLSDGIDSLATNKNADSGATTHLQSDLWSDLWAMLRVDKEALASGDRSKNNSTPESLRVSKNRAHDAILITGRRGEGKTTVLLQLLEEIENNKSNEAIKYESLGLIDPTLLETKQNLMLSIVQRLREYLKQQTNTYSRSSEHDEKLKNAQRALTQLANGLTVLDGIGNDLHSDENWANATFIMDDGLEQAEAAYGFERSFRHFVKCTAELVGCDAFVLCIDDVDTKSEMGAPVLEALRKYLTSPYLRIVVSGDLELLQSLARKIQLNGLGQDFLNFEANLYKEHRNNSRINGLLEQLSGLEDQFLTKIFSPHRRIPLQTLNEIQATSKNNVQLHWKVRCSETQRLDRELDEIITAQWGLRDPISLQRFRSALYSMPVRSIVSFFQVLDNKQDYAEQRPTTARRLMEISRTQLADYDLRIDDLYRILDPEMQLRRIVMWLSETPDRWGYFSDMLPEGSKETLDRAILALSATLTSRLLTSPSGAIQYWLLFCLIKDRLDRNIISDGGSKENDLANFISHLRLNKKETLEQFAGRAAAWERTRFNKEGRASQQVLNKRSIYGVPVATDRVRNPNNTVALFYARDRKAADWNPFFNAKDPKSDKEITEFIDGLSKEIAPFHRTISKFNGVYGSGQRAWVYGTLFNSIESLCKKLDDNAAIILMLPYSTISSGQSYEFGNYSFLKMIAGIGEISASSQRKKAFESWATIESFPIAIAGSEEGIESEESDAEYTSETSFKPQYPDQNGELFKILSQWVEQSPPETLIPPHVLSKIWKKFSDGMIKVHNNTVGSKGLFKNRDLFLGRLIHRSIIVFLHAMGVELYLNERGELPVRMQNSPTGVDGTFIEFLMHLEKDRKDENCFSETAGGKLFFHILLCPVWRYFLNPLVGLLEETIEDEKILELWGKRLKYNFLSAHSFDVTYKPYTSRDAPKVPFDGLYYLLNTVAISEANIR